MPEGNSPMVDISPIPKFFWYSIGIFILLIGAAIAVSLIRHNDMTLEIASAKVEMVNSAADVERATADLTRTIHALQDENARLKQVALRPALSPLPFVVAPATQPSMVAMNPEPMIGRLNSRAQQMYRQAGIEAAK